MIWAGAKRRPAHYYEACPHFRRLYIRHGNRGSCYRLAENANVLSLIRCHWCRAKYLEEMVKRPDKVVYSFDEAMDKLGLTNDDLEK